MKKTTVRRLLPGSMLAGIVLCLGVSGTAVAASVSSDAGPSYKVPLYKSIIVPLQRSAKRVSVGNPGVADILVIRNDELYVVGKALGSTNVVAWDGNGYVFESFQVEVTHDLETLKSKLHELLPGEKINVQSAQEQLVLSGQVSSAARMDAAREVANAFLTDCIAAESDAPVTPVTGSRTSGGYRSSSSCKKGAVVNLMQVGGSNQVMVKVTVAEVARSVVKRLDANLNLLKFGASDGRLSGGVVNGGASFPDALDQDGLARLTQGSLVGGGLSPIGPNLDLYAPTTPVIDSSGLFLGYLNGTTFVEAVLDISKRNGMAKILSEPTLTTMTGQEAKFLSGGEFPVPVPQGGASNSVTIEFKEFGVELKVLPVVLDSGHINMKLDVAVSELSNENPVLIPGAGGSSSSFLIPSLTKRSAASVIELASGQTIGIAGLISDNVREFVEKFPGLGDLPILGALFRSQSFQAGQTELVIFVTPQLAKPISPSQVRLPTDGFVVPSDFGFYLMGSMSQARGSGESRPQPQPMLRDEAPVGSYGHELPTNP